MNEQYVPPKPEPAPVKNAIPSIASSKKTSQVEYEVLNPRGVAAAGASNANASSSKDTANGDGNGEDEESADLPELTPSLEAFSHLPIRGFEESWEFIKQHRDVVVPGASDALLVAAFKAQSEGKSACDQLLTNEVRVDGRVRRTRDQLTRI